MPKITTTVIDGWPMMTPLGRREQQLLQAELADGETVLGQVIGTFSQAVVATDLRVLILKSGLTSGQAFGGRTTSYDYREIERVELRARIAEGELEIIPLGGTPPNLIPGRRTLREQPNGVVFSKLDRDAFTAMADRILDRV